MSKDGYLVIISSAIIAIIIAVVLNSPRPLDPKEVEGMYSFNGKVLSVSEDVMFARFEEEVEEDRAVFMYDETRAPKNIYIGDEVTIYTYQNPLDSKQVLAERIVVY